jgi:hypothetical protein
LEDNGSSVFTAKGLAVTVSKVENDPSGGGIRMRYLKNKIDLL